VLHEKACIDLADPRVKGLNLAVYSTVPLGAGVSSSAAVEVATMIALLDHFGVSRAEEGSAASRSAVTPMGLAALCQEVENRVVGAPCGIMDQVTSCYGRPGTLLRMVCQPHELQPPLALPAGVRVLGIDSRVRHSVGGPQYARTRCAAFMGHKIILDRMRRIGAAAGRELTGDPLRGYLANLDPDDYKRLFRPALPESIKGGEFLLKYGPTIDAATTVEPDVVYPVIHAVDHHVLEARRVPNFVEFLAQAADLPPGSRERGRLLDKAGHLMYASHLSYTNDAMLGAPECDLLVQLVRDRERHGLYGAKITGGGSGGTVAVLADQGERADAAIAEIMAEYERQTGKRPEAFTGTSPGAWHLGTRVV
jgi:L-arabinokinase